jgi:hypothetical protein
MTQRALLCGCGASIDDAGNALLCAACTRRRQHDRAAFGGLREAALQRDGYQCQACGEMDARLVLVHHRKPGRNALKFFLTLCRACHPRIHHTGAPGFAFATTTPILFVLWRELHRKQPVQLLLFPDALPAPSQFALFEPAGIAA